METVEKSVRKDNEHNRNERCKLRLAKETFMSVQAGWMLPKGRDYNNLINKG